MKPIDNISMSLTDSSKKSWLIRGGVVLAGIAGLALVLPVVYFAFLSALGLLGLMIAGVIGFAFVMALPMLGQKMENKLLAMRKSEAHANPIEQIENNVIRKATQLDAFKRGMETIGSQIMSLSDSLKVQQRKDPEENFSDQIQALDKMKLYYDAKKATYAKALAALEEYKKAVERAKFKFGFGNAAAGIAQAMNANDAEALMQNMLSDEAFKAVDHRFNSAFAALDMDSVELTSKSKMDFNGLSLDVHTIDIPTMQPIKAKELA